MAAINISININTLLMGNVRASVMWKFTLLFAGDYQNMMDTTTPVHEYSTRLYLLLKIDILVGQNFNIPNLAADSCWAAAVVPIHYFTQIQSQ